MGIGRNIISGIADYLQSRDEAKAMTTLNIQPPAFREQGLGGNAVQTFSSMSEWQSVIDQALTRWNGSNINYASEVGDLRLSVLIMAAVNWAGVNASMGQWKVVEVGGDDKETDLPDHEFVQLFEGEDDPDFQLDMLWRQWMASWIIKGVAYGLYSRDGAGRIKRITFEPPT